jgi:hypothetical protein
VRDHLVVASVMLLGCGSADPPATADAAVDTGTLTDAATEGPPSATYPAFAPDTPSMRNLGGYVMKAPKIVTVTWKDDPNAALVEEFGDKIGASSYWKAITEEYGVGPATSGAANHIRMPEKDPPSLKPGGLRLFVLGQLADLAASGWPAPTPDTIYMLYLPACPEFGAYHQALDVGGTIVAYGVAGTCPLEGVTPSDALTVVGSHELSEAATDPHVNFAGKKAWSGFEPQSLGWELWTSIGAESADVCQFINSEPNVKGPADLSYLVQRQWSNKLATAGKDPCVVGSGRAYFNVVAQGLEDITQDMTTFMGEPQKTKGFNVKVGASKDITLGFFSSAPTADWSISVSVGNAILKTFQDTGIEASIVGPATGNNGSTAILRVRVTAPGVALKDSHLLTITSKAGATTQHYPLLVTNN